MPQESWKSLQPLRIPPGWTFLFHKLEDVEPEDVPKDDELWLEVFTQDIMYLYANVQRKRNKQIEKQKLAIDLGWYPDGEPDGAFRMVALLNDDWEAPLLEFSSRSKAEVVEKLESWLFKEFFSLQFIEDVFRKEFSKGNCN